eukprot:TRINITY_DN9183_c1_g1_i1.p1 TRINITY_DN9183_c1_g1~~TRINITY_DN9183_c1_g1_i1.p1  ORF type:complete len:297 (+),score=49.19 TRINITY_DN9183_c1_g1_i1:147-1037(+)
MAVTAENIPPAGQPANYYEQPPRKSSLTKKKCFNKLPEQYQWRPELDEDYIFPGELEMIAKLREHFGKDLESWSDKRILYFLLARRDELEPTKILLGNYIKTAKAVGCFNRRTTLAENEGFKRGVRIFFKGQYDSHDRYISYFHIGKHIAREVSREQMFKYLIYEAQFRVETETLRYLRNGSLEIIDMTNFGWNNFDPSPTGKETAQQLQGTFPRRIRDITVVNAGWIFRVALKAAKMVMPKKLMKRVSLGSIEKLKEMVPKNMLLSSHGGDCKLGLEDFIKQLEDYDREFANKTF